MEQHEYELTDPLDHEIARRLKNAVAPFNPPAHCRKRIKQIASLIGISPFLYSVSTLAAPRDIKRSIFVAYPRNPWDEALNVGPLFSRMVFCTS
jgi:hypothetical protein